MNPTLALLVDGVIVVTGLECVALLVHHRLTGAGVKPGAFLLNLVSGLCLMLALRSVVHDASMAWTALWLLAAGMAHAADLHRRWVRRSPAIHRYRQ